MNKLSKETQFVDLLLRRQRTPKTMKWIVEQVDKQFPGVNHRKVWNILWNGCVNPQDKPRFKQVLTEERTLFISNNK